MLAKAVELSPIVLDSNVTCSQPDCEIANHVNIVRMQCAGNDVSGHQDAQNETALTQAGTSANIWSKACESLAA